MRAQYQFAAGIGLAIEGDAATVSQFNREYGTAAEPRPIAVAVEVAFSGRDAGRSGQWIQGGHKSVHWRTQLTEPDATTLGVRIELAGWPRTFGRTLVQGYFIESLISVAAARAGAVLLPAAAFRDDAGALIVLGQSASGKTSLSMHALAIGAPVYGDDQVLIDRDGTCRAFPRRLRLYSDLSERAPVAFRRLPRGAVARLRALRLMRLISGGAIAPSLPVPISILGQSSPPQPLPIHRIVMLERASSPGPLRTESATVADAVSRAHRLLLEQREHLALAGGDAWRDSLLALGRDEDKLVERAFASAFVERITAPSPLSGDAMAQLGAAVGLVPRLER